MTIWLYHIHWDLLTSHSC